MRPFLKTFFINTVFFLMASSLSFPAWAGDGVKEKDLGGSKTYQDYHSKDHYQTPQTNIDTDAPSQEAKDDFSSGFKSIGRGFVNGTKATGRGIKKAGQATGRGFKKFGQMTGHGFKKAGSATAGGFKTAGRSIKNFFSRDKGEKAVQPVETNSYESYDSKPTPRSDLDSVGNEG